ncbi:hypothetical protein Dsin_004607 [Dipteronia sinensis]|uniref:Uncharacterized protein n=1 Tax=Dipteronia sinensis TaxID=43782 RepID=A0AAE0AVW3_9ROSI|nr:hypothetical protein Dsin_004607 [Dipteronia sinensis]
MASTTPTQRFVTASRGSSSISWHPNMTDVDTTTSSYWFNWRVTICAVWVFISIVFASFLIWKYEGFRNSNRDSRGGETLQQETAGSLYEDETWKTCLKGVHPAWLLAFRVIAFIVLLILVTVTACVDGGTIFYYYTQWTCTLITTYFGLGSFLSMYGCYQYHKSVSGDKVDNVEGDTEQGNFVAPSRGEKSNDSSAKITNTLEESHPRKPAGMWGYLFQIIFQMSAGAVLLTDCVFWFIIVPFLEINNYGLNIVSILISIFQSNVYDKLLCFLSNVKQCVNDDVFPWQLVINMHTINAVFLLGDAALNCLRFPLFRIAYFFLWTVTFVIFQWILHAFVMLWWPYPFLDLSSSYAPLWYFSVALMHIPCYGVFALTIKLKHALLSKWFPDSYQCVR